MMMKPVNLKNFIKFSILTLFVIIIISIAVSGKINLDDMITTLEDLREKPYAPFLYMGIYILGVIFAIPGTLLTVAAGPIFGPWEGILYVVIASNTGCFLTFLLSRYLGRDLVARLVPTEGYLDKLEKSIEKNGFVYLLYIRLLPIFPFNVINYLSGLTPIRLKDYVLATFFGMLPGTAVYVYVSFAAFGSQDNKILLASSLVFLALYTGIIFIVKKRSKLFKEEKDD